MWKTVKGKFRNHSLVIKIKLTLLTGVRKRRTKEVEWMWNKGAASSRGKMIQVLSRETCLPPHWNNFPFVLQYLHRCHRTWSKNCVTTFFSAYTCFLCRLYVFLTEASSFTVWQKWATWFKMESKHYSPTCACFWELWEQTLNVVEGKLLFLPEILHCKCLVIKQRLFQWSIIMFKCSSVMWNALLHSWPAWTQGARWHFPQCS